MSPGGIAPRQIDQDAVEAVPPLQLDQGFAEGFRGMPDVDRAEAGLQEVVPERELAHHRHAVGLAQPHGRRHALAAGQSLAPTAASPTMRNAQVTASEALAAYSAPMLSA